MIPLTWFIGLGLILFMIGVAGVLLRKNIIIVLMSIELMLNSVNINLVTFSYYLDDLRGQIFAIFTITVAAAEVAVALGILIALVRNRRVINSDDMDSLKG
ncbi:NADH-ubiquinone oxidoreductase chain K [hydrothermal vent metagenome]|uniref:NADH-ubiquinone oxidoreductase chain K n=1 Tax=hydrothermal vent metagenome TaxID=652676 RepID=A0A3B0QS05_9ZZZZ